MQLKHFLNLVFIFLFQLTKYFLIFFYKSCYEEIKI